MRSVKRIALGKSANTYLKKRKKVVSALLAADTLDIEYEWKKSRDTQKIGMVLGRVLN